MRYIFAAIALTAGILVVIHHRYLTALFADTQARNMKQQFGSLASDMNWDEPKIWQSLGYRQGMLGAGVALILVAIYLIFGTINID